MSQEILLDHLGAVVDGRPVKQSHVLFVRLSDIVACFHQLLAAFQDAEPDRRHRPLRRGFTGSQEQFCRFSRLFFPRLFGFRARLLQPLTHRKKSTDQICVNDVHTNPKTSIFTSVLCKYVPLNLSNRSVGLAAPTCSFWYLSDEKIRGPITHWEAFTMSQLLLSSMWDRFFGC